VVLEHVRRTGRVSAEPCREGEIAVEPHDCAGSAVHDVTMFGSLSRPGEPQPPDHQFNFSNSHFTVVRKVAPSLHILGLADSDVDEPKWKSTGHLARLGRELIPEQTIIRILTCSSDDTSRCCGNTAWGGSKMTSGSIDITGDLLARSRADRVERKALRNQCVYA